MSEPAPRSGMAARGPTLHLIVGLPGAGKTTLARKLERELQALRLSPDEWVAPLFGEELSQARLDAVRDPIESVQWAVARDALKLGLDVILEFGFWSRSERELFRNGAAAVGAGSQVHGLTLPLEELWARLERRNAHLPPATFRITREQLESWWAVYEPPAADELLPRPAPARARL